MPRPGRPKSKRRPPSEPAQLATRRPDGPLRLRIVGGTLRGRPLKYSGDARIRPMKDRVREAVFNLLGPRVKGLYAWDLFAGTGAMGLEAISRGALGATMIEQHIPTTRLLRENAESLGVADRVRVIQANAFHWMRSAQLPDALVLGDTAPAVGWLVFCCPPYAHYHQRRAEVDRLMHDLRRQMPPGSLLVVEAESPFDVTQLVPGDWQVREYPPAVIGIVQIAQD